MKKKDISRLEKGEDMREVKHITQTTENKFLNMYVLDMESDTGRKSKYFVASRAKSIEELKITTRKTQQMV